MKSQNITNDKYVIGERECPRCGTVFARNILKPELKPMQILDSLTCCKCGLGGILDHEGEEVFIGWDGFDE